MSLEIREHITILIELNKAVKALHFYPPGHPNLDATFNNFYNILKNKTLDHGEIKWRVDQRGFYSDKTPLSADNPQILDLARRLFRRRIKEITFTSRITVEDVKTLLSIIDMEPEEIVKRGGLEMVLAERGATGILLNEMDYESLKKLAREMEEKKKEEALDIAEEPEPEPETDGGSEEPLMQEALPETLNIEEAKEETLEELLEKIKNERDFLRYNDLSVRISERALPLVSERRFNELFDVLDVFSSHCEAEEIDGDIKAIAEERLEPLLTDEVILYLIKRLGNREDPAQNRVVSLLLKAGERAVAPLLDELQDTPDSHARRNIFNTLVKFGPAIREKIEERLTSEHWFVVRQMVALLGMLGHPDSVAALEGVYEHPNVKVKREVLKSLARIHSPKSVSLLLQALNDQERTIVLQAILSLGMLKDPVAVDALGGIIFKWAPFSGRMEEKKEAVKALGLIGDQSAVPYLKKLLLKNPVFRRRANDELRVLAANSLAKIGTPEAFEAIEQGMSNSSGDVHNTCKKILEWRKADDRTGR